MKKMVVLEDVTTGTTSDIGEDGWFVGMLVEITYHDENGNIKTKIGQLADVLD